MQLSINLHLLASTPPSEGPPSASAYRLLLVPRSTHRPALHRLSPPPTPPPASTYARWVCRLWRTDTSCDRGNTLASTMTCRLVRQEPLPCSCPVFTHLLTTTHRPMCSSTAPPTTGEVGRSGGTGPSARVAASMLLTARSVAVIASTPTISGFGNATTPMISARILLRGCLVVWSHPNEVDGSESYESDLEKKSMAIDEERVEAKDRMSSCFPQKRVSSPETPEEKDETKLDMELHWLVSHHWSFSACIFVFAS